MALNATPAGGSGSYASYQWYRNTVAIMSANASTYGATQGGSYTVTVTDSLGYTSAASGAVVLNDDTGAPTVTAPGGATVTQTTCQ